MKTKLLVFLALCATLTFFSSCKKDEPKVDAREQFLGAWKGTIFYVVENFTDKFDRYVVIKKTDNSSNKITFADFSSYNYTPFTGTVNGSTVTFDQWVYKYQYTNTDKKTTNTLSFTHNGTGNISGSSLSSTGALKLVNEDTGESGTGTWTIVWTKQ